jgi:ribonuclease HII
MFRSKSTAEIQKIVTEQGNLLSDLEISALSQDSRTGVRKIYQQFCRQRALLEKENIRLRNMALYENQAREKGFKLIAGVDEAGRGPLAGPVVAAVVILPEGCLIQGVNDSKKLTPLMRARLVNEIKEKAVCWAVGLANVEEIDTINILQASLLAMRRAVQNLAAHPDYILVDAVRIPELTVPQLPIIKGDGKSISIAAASIIAKVTRDRMMEDYDNQFPDYGFAKHKGYGTRDHIEAIQAHGCCSLHRQTFVKNITISSVDGKLR